MATARRKKQGGDQGACKLLGCLLGNVIEVLEVLEVFGCLLSSKNGSKWKKKVPGSFYFGLRKSTCFVRDLQGNDLLTGNRGSNLYTISLQETTLSTPICFMAKALPTQAWLRHRRLSHLNFDYITLLSKKDVV
ncbi:retrovirus-related pol polyprotein from transposon TNT 1-94, partial [Tanacetum coccineum]